MAVIAITDNNTRRQDMEGAVSGTTNIGAGAGPATFAEAIYQGVQTWGRKIGIASSLRGFFVNITSIDMTAAANKVLLHKSNIVNSAAIHSLGLRARIGSATTAYHELILKDDGTQGDNAEFEYPILGGWIITPIDPNVSAWIDDTTGIPSLTAVTEVAFAGAVTITTVNENIIADALDFSEGLFLVGGDGADADGVWQDFVDDDEGTVTAGRFGHASTREGILFLFGRFVVGRNASATVTATVFQDTNQTIVFPGGLVDAGWNGVEIDCGNATTDVDFTSLTLIGRGRDNLKQFFDTENEVDGANDEIDIVAHGFSTGEALIYSKEGGSESISGNLLDGDEVFVERRTVDSFGVHETDITTNGRASSFVGGAALLDVGPSAAGNGESHSFRRQPDTRPDLDVIGTSGSFDATACSFIRFRQFNLTSAATLTACSLVNCFSLSLNQGKLDDCVIDQPILSPGEAFVLTPDLADITDCVFAVGSLGGHAVEIDTTGTYTLDGNTFTDYGQDRTQFDTETDVTGGATDTIAITAHGWIDGEEVYYHKEGGTEAIGLTDQVRYFVNSVDANTISLHVTKFKAAGDTDRVDLTPSGAGNGETHSLYSANAAILNDTGGAVTINVTNATSPTVRNGAGATTTVNNNVTVTFTGLKDNSEIWVFPTGVRGQGNEIAEIEDATAGSPDDRTFAWSAGAGVGVDYIIHNWQPGVAVYEEVCVINFIVPSVDTAVGIQQRLDRNAV